MRKLPAENSGVPAAAHPQPAPKVQEHFDFLCSVPILAELDESALWPLAQQATERAFEPGETVMHEGDGSGEFFIIRSGQADVFKVNELGDRRHVARLARGSYFGELGLLTNSPRSASVDVTVSRPLIALAFDAQLFHEIIAEQVLLFRLQRERKRVQRNHPSGELRIQELAMLHDLDESELEYVVQASTEQTFSAGEVIFYEDDDADRFYIVLEGELDVERRDEIIATLVPGDFFGETALLFDSRRTATVRAWEDSKVWSISREAFQKVVAHYLLRDSSLRPKVLARLR